ncbi:hypothetical protein ERJ75_000387000 [Trypanosoma vivax]|nr:hypothetical protein ERJ75_000387000 [Trypanosoma vivax]
MTERAGSKNAEPHTPASQAHAELAQVTPEPAPVLLRTTSILKKDRVSSASAKCAGDAGSCARVLGAPVVANVPGPATTARHGATTRVAEHTTTPPSEGAAPHQRYLPSRLGAVTQHTVPAPSPTEDMDRGDGQTAVGVPRGERPGLMAGKPEAGSFLAVHAGEGYFNPQMGSNCTRAGRSAYEMMLPGSFYASPATAGSTHSHPDRGASVYGAVLPGSFYASPATAGGAYSLVSGPSLYVQRTNSSADGWSRSSVYGGMVRGVDCAFGAQSSLYDSSRDCPARGRMLGSLYGDGSISHAVQKDTTILCANIATIGKHNALRRSGKRGGVKANAKISASADAPSGCGRAPRPAQGSARDPSATAKAPSISRSRTTTTSTRWWLSTQRRAPGVT